MNDDVSKLKKEELEEIFESLKIPYNEGIQNDKDKNAEARIVFWDYYWKPMIASGTEYATNVSYQVSFFSRRPRHEKLLELKRKLAEKKIFVIIELEYNQKEQIFHSYFKVDVLENLYDNEK